MTDQKSFIRDESGAVTVDWVVLTAALVGLGLAVATVLRGGVDTVSDAIDATLRGDGLVRVAFADANISALGTEGPALVAEARGLSNSDLALRYAGLVPAAASSQAVIDDFEAQAAAHDWGENNENPFTFGGQTFDSPDDFAGALGADVQNVQRAGVFAAEANQRGFTNFDPGQAANAVDGDAGTPPAFTG